MVKAVIFEERRTGLFNAKLVFEQVEGETVTVSTFQLLEAYVTPDYWEMRFQTAGIPCEMGKRCHGKTPHA